MEQMEFYTGQRVLVRDNENEQWHYNFYSHRVKNSSYPHACISSIFRECIPYVGNEELVGTTNTPRLRPYSSFIGHPVVFSMNGNVYIAHLERYDKDPGTFLFHRLYNTTRGMFSVNYSRTVKAADVDSIRMASPVEQALHEAIRF